MTVSVHDGPTAGGRSDLFRVPLIPVFSGSEVREAERPLLEAGQGPALMQRAAAGLAAHVLRVLRGRGRVYGSGVTAIVGPGSNGADALFALARLRRRGVRASAVLVAARRDEEALAAFIAAGGQVLEAVPQGQEVIVDAILGTGASRRSDPLPVPGLGAALHGGRHGFTRGPGDHSSAAGANRPTVVACDIPSGVDADTGEVLSDYGMTADLTVTFGAIKLGLVIGAGASLSGSLGLVDIGLGPHLPRHRAQLLETGSADRQGLAAASDRGRQAGSRDAEGGHGETQDAAVIAMQPPGPLDHKYSRGVLHVLAGSARYPGAAQLTVSAAVAAGTGMVTLDSEASAAERVTSAHPEVVALPTEQALDRATAVAAGPGLDGRGDGAAAQGIALERALDWALRTGRPMVIDASALELLADERLMAGALAESIVLTPHEGELAKLSSRIERLRSAAALPVRDRPSPVTRAADLAAHLGGVVLLKGAGTVIAHPEGTVIVQRSAAPGLATAGSGDVLSGILGSLLAHDDRTYPMAALAAHRHAAAAQRIDPEAHGAFGASDLSAGLRACLGARVSP